MRVTQNMMMRNYLRTMNNNLSRLAQAEQRMLGQKYTKGSDNVSDTSRALRVRQNLFENELYLTNIRDVESRLASAESNLSSVNGIIQSAAEQILIKGANDTNGTARATLATEIDNMKEEVLQFMNAQFSGSYLFGGTENGKAPFDVDANGRMTYHDMPVDEITFDQAQNKYIHTDPVTGVVTPVAEDRDQYIDVGLGMTMSGTEVDAKSGFKITFSGLDILGCGKNADGVSNNVFNMLKDAADALRAEPYDRTTCENIQKNLKKMNETIILQVSEIGTKTQFLEQTTERIDNDIYNLTAIQQKLEVSDTATESMNWKMYTAVMTATYRFGSEVLPVSLMDFIK